MVEERPKRRRKKATTRAKKAPRKKAPPKKQPVLEDDQLPGLLEGEIPRGMPVAEEEVVGEEQPLVVAEEEAVEEERPAVVAKEEAVEEERPPVVAEEEAGGAAAVEVAVPARAPRPARGPKRRAAVTEKLMSVPEFRQRVVKLVVRKFS